MEPLICSESTASTFSVPVVFIPCLLQSSWISCLLLEDEIMLCVHALVLSSPVSNGLFRSSFVKQCLVTVAWAPRASCALAIASTLARCSGDRFLSTSSGMGSAPVAWPVRLFSHCPASHQKYDNPQPKPPGTRWNKTALSVRLKVWWSRNPPIIHRPLSPGTRDLAKGSYGSSVSVSPTSRSTAME